jgi:hypothetical protein
MQTRIDARAACGEVAGVAEGIATLSPGDVVCQGDRYITCVEAESRGGVPAGTRQLAPGSSQGARHFAEGDDDVPRVPDAVAIPVLHYVAPGIDTRQFVGPIIRAWSPVTITHPNYAGPDPARRRVLPGGLSVSLEHGDAPPTRLSDPTPIASVLDRRGPR